MDKSITVPDLAKLWGVKANWILRQIAQGKLRARNISKGKTRPNYRIDQSDAKEFWDSLIAEPGKKPKAAKPITVSATSFEEFVK